jgi:hypothetical protein
MNRFLVPIVFLLAAGQADAGLRCLPLSIDLGEVRGGPPRQVRFDLVNDGKETIEILELRRGCGCMDPRLDRRTLLPGEKAPLLVDLRTGGQSNGPRSWNLRVRYRDGDTVREELLVVSATIRNEVTVNPSILALFVQGALRQELVVTDLRAKPLKVTSVETSSPALRSSVQPQANGSTRIVLDVSAAELREGRQDALVNIYTDDPLYSPVQVPVTLTRGAKPTVSVSPSQVDTQVSGAQPVSATLVRLRPAEGQKVAIESLESDDAGVTCTWAAGPGTGATLKVQVDVRKLEDRPGPRLIRVRLSEPASDVLTVPVEITRQ